MQTYARKSHPIEAALSAVPYNPETAQTPPGLSSQSHKTSRAILGGKKRPDFSLYELAEASDNGLKRMAKNYSYECKAIYKEYLTKEGGEVSEGERLAWCELFVFVSNMGIEPPDVEKLTISSTLKRLMCPHWWRRRLRVKQARTVEKKATEAGAVNLYKQIYVSDRTEARRVYQRTENARILEGVQMKNELGQEYTLAELSALSVSNPAIRRAELMTRINGFEEYAKTWGDVGEFYTITCPSRMHPSPKSAKGGKSHKYDGTTPRQAQKYLSIQWQKARAALDRAGVDYYGFRVVEPQHDSTPHWHLLLFTSPANVLFMRSVLLKYALEHDGDEKGAQKYRFKPEAIKSGINPATGREYSAAGYIAKYISKAIDGYGLKEDTYGTDAQKAASRIEAWASTWGIRQFQQIGGASVTVWRELRRLRDEEVNGNELLERARRCANDGDWFGYLNLNWFGQIELLKRDIESAGKYGDDMAAAIYGVQCGGFGVVTRPHTWEQINKGEEKTAQTAKPSSTWTRVNNCTRDNLESALKQFNDNYKSVYHARVKWAENETGLGAITSYQLVKRQAMLEILESQNGIKGNITLDRELIEDIKNEFRKENPPDSLRNQFLAIGGGDLLEFRDFKGELFKDFTREYLFQTYAILVGEL